MNKDEIAGLVEKLTPALKLLEELEVGQDCPEYAYAKGKGFQSMTYIPEAFEALRELPVMLDVLTTLSARVETLEAELGNEKAHYETAQANWDLCLDRIETLETHNSDAYIIVIDLAASLAAAISLLEKGGKAAKKAAPSDKMFDQMLRDYRESLDRARQALAGDDHG